MHTNETTFFNMNITISKLSGIEKKDHTDIYNCLRQALQSTADLITIEYTFTATHGRTSEKFATKLAETGDNVHYFADKDKKYQILGKIEKSKPSEQELVEMLTAKIELGAKYNCNLTEWNIVLADGMHK